MGFFNFSYDSIEEFDKRQHRFAEHLEASEEYLTQKSHPSSAKLDASAESTQDTSLLSTFSSAMNAVASTASTVTKAIGDSIKDDEYADLREFSPNELVEAALMVRALIHQTQIRLEVAPKDSDFKLFLESALACLKDKELLIANYMYEKHLKPSMDKKEISDDMKSKINLDTLPLKNLQPDLVKIGEMNSLFDSKNLNHLNIVSFMDQYTKIYSTKLRKTEGIYVASIDPETLKPKSNNEFEGHLGYQMSKYQKSVIMIGTENKEPVNVSLETAEKQESKVPVGPTKTETVSTTTPDSEEKPTGLFDRLSKQLSSGFSAIQTATENIIAPNETPSKPIYPSEKIKKLSQNLETLVGSGEITFDAFQINEIPGKAVASKVFLLYAQTHKIANEHQGKPIEYEFFTNTSEDNIELMRFFSKNPQLIPKGMLINFTDKKTKARINTKFIMGTGVRDKDYQNTVENGLKLENEKKSLNWLKNRLNTLSKLEKLTTTTVDDESAEKIIVKGGVAVIKSVLKNNLDSKYSGLNQEGEQLYHATLILIESAINPLLAGEISAESASNINNACVAYMATIQTLNEPDQTLKKTEYTNIASDLYTKTTDLLKTQLQQQENKKIESFVDQLTLVKLSDILYREGQIPEPIIDFLNTHLEDSLKTLRENFSKRLKTDRQKKWAEHKTTEDLPEFYTTENDETEVAIFCRQTQNFINEVIQPWAEVHFGGKVLDEKVLRGLDAKYKSYKSLVEKLPDGIPEKKAAQTLLDDVNALSLLQRRINGANEGMLKNQKVNSEIIKSSPNKTEKDNDSLREKFIKSILEQESNFLQKIEKISKNSSVTQLSNISTFVIIRQKFTNRLLDLLQKMEENPSENDFQKIKNELETFQELLKSLKNSTSTISSIPITDDMPGIPKEIKEIKELNRSLNALNPETTPENLIEDTETLTKTFSDFFEKLENSLPEDIFKNKIEKIHNVFLSDLEKLSKTNKLPFGLIEDELVTADRSLYVMWALPQENLGKYNNHYILKDYPPELFYITNGIAEKLIINEKDTPIFNDLLDTLNKKALLPEVPRCPWNNDLDPLIKVTPKFDQLRTNPDIYLMDYEKISKSDLAPYNGNCIATKQPVRLFYINNGKAEPLDINYNDCKTPDDSLNRNLAFINAIDALYHEVYASQSTETLHALQEGNLPIPQVQRLVRRLDEETRKVDSYSLNELPQPARSSLLNTIQSNPAHLIKESLAKAIDETYQQILDENKDNPAQLKLKLSEYTQKMEKLSECSGKLIEIMNSNLSVFDPNYDEKLQKYENALSAYNQALEAYKLLNKSSYYEKFHNLIHKKITEFDEEIKQNATIFTALSFLTLSVAYWVVSATRGIRAAMTESETDAKNIPDVEPNREYELSHQSPTVKQTSVSTEALGSFSTPLQRQKPREKTDEVRPENPVASPEGKNEAKIVRK